MVVPGTRYLARNGRDSYSTLRAMTCDICGSSDILEIKCKIVCRNCGTILQSCADLADEPQRAVAGSAARSVRARSTE